MNVEHKIENNIVDSRKHIAIEKLQFKNSCFFFNSCLVITFVYMSNCDFKLKFYCFLCFLYVYTYVCK